jgi:hypothetical protein
MADKIYHAKPWTPAVAQAAQRIIDAIYARAPELEVLFMGAAALGLPGEYDIDLDILCDTEDKDRYVALLEPVLGQPKERTKMLASWAFERDGFMVDAILSDPAHSHVPRQRKRFEMLKQDPQLLEKYRQFKIESDGLPYDEYMRRKKDFLNTYLPVA